MEFSVQCLASWESSLGFGVTIQDLFAHSYHENQSTLEEISPEYSLEGLMLKLKLQYFEQTLGDSGGQESLVYCSPWGHKE